MKLPWLGVVIALLLAVTPVSSSALAGERPAQAIDPMAARVPVPTIAAVAALQESVPQDPYEAVDALVSMAYGPDPSTASAAVAEILRRAGIPVVSPDGPVIAMPDDAVLVDAATYDGSVADLTLALRAGDGWPLFAFVDGLKGAGIPEEQDGLGFIEEFVTNGEMAAAMGSLGRSKDDPTEIRFAGAVMRALSGHRGEVLFSGASEDQLIDPLQFTLYMALLTSDVDENKALAVALNAPGGTARALAAAEGPVALLNDCDALVDLLKSGGKPASAGKDIFKEIVKTGIKNAVPKGAQTGVGHGIDAWDKGTSALSLALLLLGMRLELTADKTATHFKHRGGDRGPHVHLEAVARFDSNLAQEKLNCYKLAGVEILRNGPQPGFRVMWDLNQPLGSYSGYGQGNNPFPLFQQGMLLAPIRADSYKIGKVGSRGLAGEVTGRLGRSTLELYPPVERHPGQGAELYGNVYVKAALTHDDMPKLLKITDPYSVIKEATGSGGPLPFKWAVKKTIDILLSYLKRAGLPVQRKTINVGYHGPDIYRVKGSGTAWLFFYTSPYAIDLYTCDGLRVTGNAQGQTTGGRWRGTAEFGNDRWVDPAIINGLLKESAKLFHAPLGQLPHLPAQWHTSNPNVDQVVDSLSDPSIPAEIHLVVPHLDGWITIDRPPGLATVEGPNGPELVPEHLDGPVGEIELFIGPTSLHELGNAFGGLWSAKFTIEGVQQDSRCPGGPNDYYFEAI